MRSAQSNHFNKPLVHYSLAHGCSCHAGIKKPTQIPHFEELEGCEVWFYEKESPTWVFVNAALVAWFWITSVCYFRLGNQNWKRIPELSQLYRKLAYDLSPVALWWKQWGWTNWQYWKAWKSKPTITKWFKRCSVPSPIWKLSRKRSRTEPGLAHDFSRTVNMTIVPGADAALDNFCNFLLSVF
jgi:hypothetical protein